VLTAEKNKSAVQMAVVTALLLSGSNAEGQFTNWAWICLPEKAGEYLICTQSHTGTLFEVKLK